MSRAWCRIATVLAAAIGGCSWLSYTDVNELDRSPADASTGASDGDASEDTGTDVSEPNPDALPDGSGSSGETCDTALTVALDSSVYGTTANMVDNVTPSCARIGGSSADVVYRIDVPRRGDVELSTLGSGFDTIVLLSGACGDPSDALGCANNANASLTTRMIQRRLPAGTYYATVDGDGTGAAGAYALRTSFHEDVVQRTCDAPLEITAGAAVWGETVGEDTDQGDCGGADSPEEVYRFTLARQTTVRIHTIGSSFDTVLYLRRGRCADGIELACDDDSGGGTASSIDQSLNAGTYHVFVDGQNGAHGRYRLVAYFDA